MTEPMSFEVLREMNKRQIRLLYGTCAPPELDAEVVELERMFSGGGIACPCEFIESEEEEQCGQPAHHLIKCRCEPCGNWEMYICDEHLDLLKSMPKPAHIKCDTLIMWVEV